MLRHIPISFLVALLAVACNKVKQESSLPLLPVENAPNSGIRLYNFNTTDLDLRVNNIQLTNFDSTSTSKMPAPAGKAWFPTGSWPDASTGASFTIPTTLLDKQGQAHLIIKARPFIHNFKSYSAFNFLDTVIQNDPAHPADYFVLPTGHLQKLDRTLAAPSSPFDFKIRVINFGVSPDTAGLQGPATLTFADGTPVADSLTNVPSGRPSIYAELPFGAYQFKVFMNGNDRTKQLAGAGAFPIYSCSALNTGTPSLVQQSIYPVLTTFRPGYTYSIFITPAVVDFACFPGDSYIKINEYRVLVENSANSNTNFALVQGVNALPGSSSLRFTIDGQPVGNPLGYTQYTQDFYPVVIGQHNIQAYDQSGKLIAEKPCNFSAYDYITAWVYPKNGAADICFSPNDMTSSSYFVPNNTPADGTSGTPFVQTFPRSWQSRFLNLSTDLPYATFTNDLVPFDSTYNNLGQGIVPDMNWEVIYGLIYGIDGTVTAGLGTLPAAIRVYASSPGPPAIVPGQLLYGIKALYMKDFIANPGLYTNGVLPATEPGVYSVALTGSTAAGAPAGQNAQLIIVKHNK